MSTPSTQCRDACCSAFANFEDSQDFKRSKFFKKGKPGLQMASKALTTDACVKYVLTMVEGDMYLEAENAVTPKRGRKTNWPEIERLDAEWYEQIFNEIELHKNEEGHRFFGLTGYKASSSVTRILRYPKASHAGRVTDAMRAAASGIIDNMVGMIDIQIDWSSDDGGETEALQGCLPPRLSQLWPRGAHSLIIISGLHMLGHQSTPGVQQMTLADNFVHEFAHALQIAVHGVREDEAYCRNSKYAEAGFDLTSKIFGGVNWFYDEFLETCSTQRNWPHKHVQLSSVLVQSTWPCELTRKFYDLIDGNLSSRAGKGEENPVSLARRVPSAVISALFTERYWQHHFATRPEAPLICLKTPYWLIRAAANIEELCKYGHRLCSLRDPKHSLGPKQLKSLAWSFGNWDRNGERWKSTPEDYLDNMQDARNIWRKNRRHRRKAPKGIPGSK